MNTIYKPDGVLDNYLTFGVYFKSENDIGSEYIIELIHGRTKGNALINIYNPGSPLCNYFDTTGLVNGSMVGMLSFDIHHVVKLDLWGKYFFPKFNNEMQLYYDDEKYYGGKNKTNSITSLMECINYAIEYGLKSSGIKPY